MVLDTRLYSWSECEIRLNGLFLLAVTAVRWDDAQEKDYVYGKGTTPLAIKSGNRRVEGSVTLLQSDLERLQDLSPTGKAVDFVGISLQVAFINVTGEIVRYSITGLEFTSAPMGINQNDKFMQVELPFMALACKRTA
jgi:hypothetical protein